MVGSVTGEYLPSLISEEKQTEFSQLAQEEKQEAPQQKSDEAVKVNISSDARNMLTQLQGEFLPAAAAESKDNSKGDTRRKDNLDDPPDNPGRESGTGESDEGEEEELRELEQRDSEVRAHEQAHIAASGGNARGGATFVFQTGPDGKQYAIGGQVNLDTSAIDGNPEATVRKAQTLRTAAMAPAKPSSSDMAVASAATSMEMEARAQMNEELIEENTKLQTNPDAAIAAAPEAANEQLPSLNNLEKSAGSEKNERKRGDKDDEKAFAYADKGKEIEGEYGGYKQSSGRLVDLTA